MSAQPVARPSPIDMTGMRAQVLDVAGWFPSPQQHIVSVTSEWSIGDVGAFLRQQVRHNGFAMCCLPEPLACSDFVALASYFGAPEPERDSFLADRVQEGVVLNLTPDVTVGVTELTQPFSSSALTFHVEGSRRPPGTAPDYLLFQCLQAPTADAGGQTILRSIAEVLDALSPHSIDALSKTMMYPDVTTATVVGETSFGPKLNFRDPFPEEVRWQSQANDRVVSQAMSELLTQIYRRDRVFGVPWTANLLAVVDNRRWLHGRTSGGSTNRHLQRIRVHSAADPLGAL